MNPALDISTDAEVVRPTDKIRCGAARYDAGGGGINVAKIAHVLGAPVSAVYPAGGPTGDVLTDLLVQDGVPIRRVKIAAPTRESFTINESSTGLQYRFVLPGPRLSFVEQQQCLAELRDAATSARFVVASGSLPPGAPANFYQQVALVCRDLGVQFVLDTSGGGLRHITSGVYLLKASVRELRECVGRELVTESEQFDAAHEIIDCGRAKAVVVSLGSDGALLATPQGSLRFSAIPMRARQWRGSRRRDGRGDHGGLEPRLVTEQVGALRNRRRRGHAVDTRHAAVHSGRRGTPLRGRGRARRGRGVRASRTRLSAGEYVSDEQRRSPSTRACTTPSSSTSTVLSPTPRRFTRWRGPQCSTNFSRGGPRATMRTTRRSPTMTTGTSWTANHVMTAWSTSLRRGGFRCRREIASDSAEDTVCGLGNRKQQIFLERLDAGVPVFESTVALVHKLAETGIATAVYSSSRNCEHILKAAGLGDLFAVRVDGVVADALGLPGKPDPAVLLEAINRLGAIPERSVVVEDAEAGVQAGRNGGFALVIGVDRTGHADELLRYGADVVVADLADVAVRTGDNRMSLLPNALDSYGQLIGVVGGRQPFVCLDFDGTLSEIVVGSRCGHAGRRRGRGAGEPGDAVPGCHTERPRSDRTSASGSACPGSGTPAATASS